MPGTTLGDRLGRCCAASLELVFELVFQTGAVFSSLFLFMGCVLAVLGSDSGMESVT